MTKFLQTLMDGVAEGSLYALIALGYTMVYGILQFINFAHSDVFMLGAWFSYVIAKACGWARPESNPTLAAALFVLAAAMVVCGTLGFVIERLAYRPLRRAPRLNVLITAIGVSLFLENAGQLRFAFGTQPQRMPTLFADTVLNERSVASGALKGGAEEGALALDADVTLDADIAYRIEIQAPGETSPSVFQIISEPGSYRAGQDLNILPPLDSPPAEGTTFSLIREPSVPIRLVNVIAMGVAVLLMLSLEWLVFRTKLGLGMRAVSFDTRVASLMGVPVDRVISFTFVVGSMLAAAAGFLYAAKYPGLNQTASATWVLLGLKAFVAAVVGGIGNIRGAMLGGLLIGLIEFFGMAYIDFNLRDVYVFSLLILVLLVRPTGILGRAQVEKV